ncbi:unnamed protein product [Symbiodinium microadriaticum]|nr:unnamed protein product [Symbiodinium microadriaticum]
MQKTRRYFVATQDQELRNYIAGVVTGVPLLYLNKVTLVLEPPSEKSRGTGAQAPGAGNEEKDMLTRLSDATAPSTALVPTERKKRKAAAPNPLSQKKPSEDSKSTKRKKTEQYKRGGH